MKKRLISLCLALPVLYSFAGCNTSESPTAPNGGKKVDNSQDIVPPKSEKGPAEKINVNSGTIKSPE